MNIDAVVFWQIHDAERAALEIVDYRSGIARVAQTSLREMVGSSALSTLLSDRKHGDEVLRDEIARKIADWGIAVMSVEIRDISVPPALQDAMSRQAQAERERLARVLLGQAEQEVAIKFVEAADIYASSPAALQLRAMNIIYETTKERGATILMPSAMVDAMNPGAVLGLATLARPPRTAPTAVTGGVDASGATSDAQAGLVPGSGDRGLPVACLAAQALSQAMVDRRRRRAVDARRASRSGWSARTATRSRWQCPSLLRRRS